MVERVRFDQIVNNPVDDVRDFGNRIVLLLEAQACNQLHIGTR